MSPSRIRPASVLLLLAWPLSACTSWRPLPSPQPIARNVERVQVLTPSGGKVLLWYPEVKGDTLVGATNQFRRGGPDIRLGNVQSLKIRRFSAGRTVLLITGIVVGIPAIFVIGMNIDAKSGH